MKSSIWMKKIQKKTSIPNLTLHSNKLPDTYRWYYLIWVGRLLSSEVKRNKNVNTDESYQMNWTWSDEKWTATHLKLIYVFSWKRQNKTNKKMEKTIIILKWKRRAWDSASRVENEHNWKWQLPKQIKAKSRRKVELDSALKILDRWTFNLAIFEYLSIDLIFDTTYSNVLKCDDCDSSIPFSF